MLPARRIVRIRYKEFGIPAAFAFIESAQVARSNIGSHEVTA